MTHKDKDLTPKDKDLKYGHKDNITDIVHMKWKVEEVGGVCIWRELEATGYPYVTDLQGLH